ncbi:MAG: Do family serine endopeptidase [Gammaproteobacteria bacterium]|nr:Do family serine endopeptidase [Gammaproteobacteria bacterium]
MFRAFALILLLLSASLHAALPFAVDGQPLPSLAPMLKEVTPAVVNISTRGRTQAASPVFISPLMQRLFDLRGYDREKITNSLGSGVIIDTNNGYILTNNHVIENAFEITVTLVDGRELYAEVVGRDPETDVAVIKIKPGKLTQLTLADSSQLQVGDFVVAIGNPFGLGQTVTSGIVSALGRSGLGIESYENFIQTDASINPGSSGGALVNLRGELVGVNTAILGSDSSSKGSIGIGFAIPINMVRDITQQLIESGEVKRGRLGVQAQDLSPALAKALGLSAEQNGIIITQIEYGSSAYEAGVQVADVIVKANGQLIKTTGDVFNLVGLLRLGQKVELEVLRKAELMNVSLTIQAIDLNSINADSLSLRLHGAVISESKKIDMQKGELSELLVSSVKKGSQSWQLGLREGDMIYAVNNYRIKSLSDLSKVFRASNGSLVIRVKRDQQLFFVVLK